LLQEQYFPFFILIWSFKKRNAPLGHKNGAHNNQ